MLEHLAPGAHRGDNAVDDGVCRRREETEAPCAGDRVVEARRAPLRTDGEVQLALGGDLRFRQDVVQRGEAPAGAGGVVQEGVVAQVGR